MADEPVPLLRVVASAGVRRAREVWRCPVCTEAGRDSGALIAVALEAEVVAGKIVPGEAGFACMVCHQRGIVTLI